MFKRLTAILLLVAFGAGVASGAPLHSGGKECEMGKSASMEMMDCCKRARLSGETPEIQAARLCCAVNCQNGGADGPASTARVSAPQVAPAHPSAAAAPAAFVPTRLNSRSRSGPSQVEESPPVYLLNLAFLI
jgi:hypothetical protein